MKEIIAIDDLKRLIDDVLRSFGMDENTRNIVADVLLYAEMRGSSQGLVKILERTILPAADVKDISVQMRTACICHLLANGNPGMVVFQRAADEVISLCRETGLALAMTSGTATSTGSIGYYARRIADAGYIGIVMAGSPKVMGLHGSAQRSMGTNPLAFGIPTSDKPLVFDMATSAITWFDIINLSRAGGVLPPDVALNKSGQPTLDPAEALKGVLTTFAGPKGSGLALMVECLTGPLSGAGILGDQTDSRGNFLLAINPDAVLGAPGFRARVSEMLRRMRLGAAVDKHPLRLPGDRSEARAMQCVESGEIAVESSVLEALRS